MYDFSLSFHHFLLFSKTIVRKFRFFPLNFPINVEKKNRCKLLFNTMPSCDFQIIITLNLISLSQGLLVEKSSQVRILPHQRRLWLNWALLSNPSISCRHHWCHFLRNDPKIWEYRRTWRPHVYVLRDKVVRRIVMCLDKLRLKIKNYKLFSQDTSKKPALKFYFTNVKRKDVLKQHLVDDSGGVGFFLFAVQLTLPDVI